MKYLLLAFLLLFPALTVAPSTAHAQDEDEEETPPPIPPDERALAPLLEDIEGTKDNASPWRSAPVECTAELLLLRELRTHTEELRSREAAVLEREKAVEELEVQLDEKLAAVQAVRDEVLRRMQEQTERRTTRIAELAKMIASMKPKAGGPVVAQMDDDDAIRILESLGAGKAGKLLAAMSAERARALGERYIALPDPRKEAKR